jgi:hypothetical protein
MTVHERFEGKFISIRYFMYVVVFYVHLGIRIDLIKEISGKSKEKSSKDNECRSYLADFLAVYVLLASIRFFLTARPHPTKPSHSDEKPSPPDGIATPKHRH